MVLYMKSFYLVSVLVFSLIFISHGAYAAFPTDYNISATYGTFYYGLECDSTYCYAIGQDSGNFYIERYNLTLGDKKYCLIGTNVLPSNFYRVNDTFFAFEKLSGAFTYYVNTSAIATNTSCPYTIKTVGISNEQVQPGYSLGLVYNPRQNVIFPSDDPTTNLGAWSTWSVHSIDSLRFSNKSDNSTAYGMDNIIPFVYQNGNVSKFINGTYLSTLGSYHTAYGLGSTNSRSVFDLVKIDSSTTYIFVIYNSRVIRANFSSMDSLGGVPIVTALAPINNASASSNPPQLSVSVWSNLNGTITWYLDGANIGSTAYNSAPGTATIYFVPPSALTTDYHYWYANFTDSNNISWTSDTEWFLNGLANFFTDPLEATAQLIGSFYSVEDLDTSKNIFGLLASMLIPVLAIIGLASVIKIDGQTAIVLLFAFFFASLILFNSAGFVDSWIIFAIFVFTILLVIFILNKGK